MLSLVKLHLFRKFRCNPIPIFGAMLHVSRKLDGNLICYPQRWHYIHYETRLLEDRFRPLPPLRAPQTLVCKVCNA